VMAACLILVGQTAQAATNFMVNLLRDTHDADLGDNLCDVNLFGSGQQCTLRAAIEQANATPGADVINFDIPDDLGIGVKTINVGATDNGELPTITDQVSINGYSQPGASPNTLARGTNANLLIELNGTDATGAYGLEIGAGGSAPVARAA
jgi:CSLREA domain-containing protein